MGTIATGLQTRQKDCYATSERVKLTLRTNGEEANSIITPQGALVVAGFDAPATAPTVSVGTGGTLSGYFGYAYVWASTKYPFVENAVPIANGELWPRSNPSPVSAVADCSAGSKSVTLTLTTPSRTDLDRIVIYRTQTQSTAAAAQALLDAGTLYYIADVASTVASYTDTGSTDTEEPLELDNYAAPSCEFCVFDGTYWWATGSPQFTADVTLDGTGTVTISGEKWFTGRNGQVCTFAGVTSGGFDGNGSYYLKVTSFNTGALYLDADLTAAVAAISYSGTTTISVRGLTNILYRSKPFNPFSWGITTNIVTDNVVVPTPQTFVLNMGGGAVSALAVSPNGKRLKVDFESPQRTIALDLQQADSEDFGLTQVILDNTSSVTCHFAQFNAFLQGQPVLLGLDTYNGEVVASDGFFQKTIDDPLGVFLQSLPKDLRANKFIHGQYDPGTQLACFWMRLYDTPEHNNILVWYHDPSGQWGWTPDFDVLCSATVLDAETTERYLIGGTELGFFGRLLAPATTDSITGLPCVTNWLFASTVTSISPRSDTPAETTFQSLGLQYFSLTEISAANQTDPSGGVFRTATVQWVVNQDVCITDSQYSVLYSGRVLSIEQISANLWETTIDSAYTADPAGLLVGFHPRYVEKQWLIVGNQSIDIDGNQLTPYNDCWYVKPEFIEINSGLFNAYIVTFWNVSYFFRLGDESLTETWTTLPWPHAAGYSTVANWGAIPVAIRSYFDLDTPTIDKKNCEFWATIGFTDTSDILTTPIILNPPFSRFYVQYAPDSGTTANPQARSFVLTRDVLLGENSSTASGLAWYNKTEVPSDLYKEFGWEIVQCDTEEGTFFNFTVKVNQAT